MLQVFRNRPLRQCRIATALVAACMTAGMLACHDTVAILEPTDSSHRLSVRVGQRVEIVLQTIGPGEYASPPRIAPAVVDFLDVGPDGFPNPGGPRQRFRFRAAAPGEAVITFTHTGFNATVQDTITVR